MPRRGPALRPRWHRRDDDIGRRDDLRHDGPATTTTVPATTSTTAATTTSAPAHHHGSRHHHFGSATRACVRRRKPRSRRGSRARHLRDRDRHQSARVLLGASLRCLGNARRSHCRQRGVQPRRGGDHRHGCRLRHQLRGLVPTHRAPRSSDDDIPEGKWVLGTHISPGTYQAPGGNDCTWERLSGVSGTPEEIIATDQPAGEAVVEIDPGDFAFNSVGCGEWAPA